jgi:general secretion pathway protein D
MVFLRPVVVRNAADSDALAQGRYDLMRNNQISAQPVPSSTMPINESAVLPATKPR